MIRLGVTGTDTGVGKTVIARALVAAFVARGLRVAAMKPVETGTDGGPPRDALRLAAAAGGHDALGDVCPITFAEPLAPLVAAERAKRPVDVAALDGAFARLTAGRDAIVVEGAGGLLVPLTERLSYADLFARWRLGLVVVAANRLGALNHTLLTVQAARAAGLPIRCVVMNSPVRERPDLAAQTNVEALTRLLPRVPILAWPWLPDVDDDRVLAWQAEQLGLVSLQPMEQTT
ncbi:MAG TPA: dethiobiotin synthase [Gemmatimonadales bacterium]|nr:dethiobiotin synthase [Gemmatimonadales bacterium]